MEKIWKDEYVNLMEDIKFSSGQKEKMVHFLVNADNKGEGIGMNRAEKSKTGIRLPLRRLAAAGICICILAAGTAVAGASGLLKQVWQNTANRPNGIYPYW